jgi:hypothetical protein
VFLLLLLIVFAAPSVSRSYPVVLYHCVPFLQQCPPATVRLQSRRAATLIALFHFWLSPSDLDRFDRTFLTAVLPRR